MRGVDDVSGNRKGSIQGKSAEASSNSLSAASTPAERRRSGFAPFPGRRHIFQFANDEASASVCEIVNAAAAVGEDGWAQIAPFGDFPGMVTEVLPGGSVKGQPVPAIQRMDRAAAEAMVAAFNRPWSKFTRWLKGLPIFSGHPDFPGTGGRYPDKTQKGVIASLQVRNDGLYALPVFNAEGQALIDSQPGLGFSARWTAEPVETVNGVRILRPAQLISAGLTTNPNLPVQLINEAPMDLKALIAALKRLGVSVADDADLATLTTAVVTAADKADADKAAASTQAANDRSALAAAQNDVTALRGQLVSAKAAHATDLINEAVRSGRVTEADRARLVTEFANDFTAAAAGLAARPVATLKTKPAIAGATAATSSANLADRQRTSLQLINELVSKGTPYNEAYNQVRAARPELFGEAAKA